MKFFTDEVKIALVAVVGIVLLYFGLNFLKGMSVFSKSTAYYIRFTDISGLTESNPIYANGYQVGVVKDIVYDYSGREGVVVKFDVDRNLRMPEGTTAEIESDIMGNVKMNLILTGHSQQMLEPGDTISGSINEGVTGAVSKLMPDIERVVPKLDSILTGINILITDPALARSLHNVEAITASLATTSASLNTLVAGLNTSVPVMMNKAELALDKADVTLDNTSKLTANFAAIDVAGTMAKVNQTLANVQEVSARLNSNEGTLGLLMNDASLYNNLNSTMVSADSLLTNIKAHPKRYVHFSLFGRKAK